MINVELRDPLRDPEPPGWTDFHQCEGLTGSWDYEVLRAASATWSPVLLAVFRDGGRIVGTVGCLYRGLRTSGAPRRGPASIRWRTMQSS